jgi:hypothetical protein
MIRPELSKWEYKKELEGLLIFAQVLDEMLFHHTIDTYKAPALNVRTNILELMYLAGQLRNNKIRLGTIQPVIDELEYRVKHDLVIKPKYSSVFSNYLKHIEQLKAKPIDLISLLQAFSSELDDFYWENLLLIIEEKIIEGKRKSDIISLVSTFITEAEVKRFSRSFIYYKAHGYFFMPDVHPKKIRGADQIKEFLSFFNQEPASWQVIFRGAEEFKDMVGYADYYSEPEFSLAISSTIPSDVPIELRERHRFLVGENQKLPLYVSVNMSEKVGAKEPSAARDMAKESIDILSDIYSFVVHQGQSNISEDALVINKNAAENSILQPSPNLMKCGIQRQSGSDAKPVVELFIDIVNRKHFDLPSSRLIARSLDFHRAALEAKTPENQLLDLWAALEGFLPPPPDDGARVIHFVNTLVPSLTLTYPEKIFHYLAESIYHGGGKCRDIIENLEMEGDFFTKTLAIVVCSDLKDKRELLYGELDKHVLLRNRIYEVHEYFKSKQKIKETILFHRKWIAWHIQRIYTTRNQIIHNADSLPYLSTLVENLHSYFDILVETTSVVSLLSKTRLSISSALDILSIHEEGYLNFLDGEDIECTTKNCVDLVFGAENPVALLNTGISFY